MKLFFLLSLLAMSLVHEGTSSQGTCDCHEIMNATAHLEYKLSLTESSLTSTMERLLKPIQTQLDYLLRPPLDNSQNNPAASCKELHELHPDVPSGYYWIGKSGSSLSVYCDMTRTCGDLTGGWMRVANIDMTYTSQQCPSGFTLTSSPKRACSGKPSVSTSFPVHKVEYNHVCGRVIGYQYKGPVAFYPNPSYGTTIDGAYVTGVSLTHGRNPRKHIWSFAVASDETTYDPSHKCPCINTKMSPPAISIPSFVGSDYFCDTALTQYSGNPILYTSDPLWDGEGCGPTNTCCSDPNASVHPPWFIKDLPSRTSDDVEMRLFRPWSNGHAEFEIVELYVQ